MSVLLLVLALLATLAIFATTTSGREVLKRTAFRDRVPGAAPSKDYDYLFAACGEDRAEADRRIAFEAERYPQLTEAEHYRRAVRKVFAERVD